VSSRTECATDRALNRALLARQGLLAPFHAPVAEVVEAIGAIQAQAWAAPPVALWSRMRAFTVEDLHAALARRDVVAGTLMRATLHLVSAREHPAYHAVAEASGATDWRRTKAPRTAASDGLRTALLEHAADVPRSGEEIAAFAEAWVAAHPDAIAAEEVEHQRRYNWRALARWSALTRVPADGVFTAKAPAALLAAPEAAAPPDADEALAIVVRRHLRAFGPAGAEDVAGWIGRRTPPVRAALDALAPDLVAVEDEHGRTLYDLPDAPRPDARTTAPPRFLAAFDSALLAYPADRRTRIVPDDLRDLVYLRRNLQIRPTFLVDGFVAGIWAIEGGRREATLTLTPGAPLADGDRTAVEAEGERLLRWARPEAKSHRVAVA
jgi:winged helix DNA-binding protein